MFFALLWFRFMFTSTGTQTVICWKQFNAMVLNYTLAHTKSAEAQRPNSLHTFFHSNTFKVCNHSICYTLELMILISHHDYRFSIWLLILTTITLSQYAEVVFNEMHSSWAQTHCNWTLILCFIHIERCIINGNYSLNKKTT